MKWGSRFVSTWSRSRSRSRRPKNISLDGRENLDGFQKLVSTIEKSRSRSRNLDFVSTRPKSPKSLDRDREIRRDLKFLAFLDSLSRSRPRSAWIFVFSRRDFLICWDFRPRRVSTNLDNLDASRQSRLKNLDFKNLDREKKKLISTVDKISTI